MIRRTKNRVKKTPYDRPQEDGGFFFKIRRLFSSPVYSSTTQTSSINSLQEHQSSPLKIPNNGGIQSSPQVTSNNNPNETLADFFSKKGDEPLSDIEIEGVLSLLNKAHTQNQSLLQSSPLATNKQRSGSITTVKGSIIGGNSTMNNSLLANTTILRPATLKTPVKIQTPSYTPKMSEIKRNGRPVIIPQTTRRRIVDYSSLPSPFRARISSPLHAYIKSKEQEKFVAQQKTLESDTVKKRRFSKEYAGGAIDLSNLDNDDDDDEVKMIDSTVSKLNTSSRPLSKTAVKVLSLLDGTPSEPEQPPKKLIKLKQPTKVEMKPPVIKPIIPVTKSKKAEVSISATTEPKIAFSRPVPAKESTQKTTETTSNGFPSFNFKHIVPSATTTKKPEPKVTDLDDDIEIIEELPKPTTGLTMPTKPEDSKPASVLFNGSARSETPSFLPPKPSSSSSLKTPEIPKSEVFKFPDVSSTNIPLKSILDDSMELETELTPTATKTPVFVFPDIPLDSSSKSSSRKKPNGFPISSKTGQTSVSFASSIGSVRQSDVINNEKRSTTSNALNSTTPASLFASSKPESSLQDPAPSFPISNPIVEQQSVFKPTVTQLVTPTPNIEEPTTDGKQPKRLIIDEFTFPVSADLINEYSSVDLEGKDEHIYDSEFTF